MLANSGDSDEMPQNAAFHLGLHCLPKYLCSRAVEIPCPTCSTWSHFIQDKLKISIYLSLDKYKCISSILYFIFSLFIKSSHLALKTVWILISWLLQKPADQDLHCLQEKPADQDTYCLQELISGFILFLKE